MAGIPGAGKSTALDTLEQGLRTTSASHGPPSGDLVILDSGSVRRWLCARLPRVSYPLLRPVVHVTHWARILARALTEPRPLVVHETATRALTRQALRALAQCGRRPAHLVWIDVPAPVALRGQIDRCRLIRPRAFARHLQRVEQEHPATAARRTWDTVRVTDRDHAPAVIAACTAR
ncbi:MAG TPA: AAA family ATPase [Kineosporiaceae bacterium]